MRQIRKRVAVVLLPAALAIGAAACGGSSSPTAGSGGTGSASSSSTANSGADFVAKALAACHSADQQEKALTKPSSSDTKLADYAPYLQQVVNLGQNLLNQLKALTPPAAQASKVQQLLDGLQSQVAAAQEAQQAAANNDLTAFQAAGKKIDDQSKALKPIAESVGLADCASGNSGSGNS